MAVAVARTIAMAMAMVIGVLPVQQPTTPGRSRHVSALIRIALPLGLLVAAATTTTTCNGFFVSESSSVIGRSILHRRTTTLTTTCSTYSARGAPRRRDKIVCLTTYHEPSNAHHHWEQENTNSSVIGSIGNSRIGVSNSSSIEANNNNNNNNINSENVDLDLDLDLNPTEQWCLDTLEEWYEHSQKRVKCPFFRRRFGDILDRIEGLVRFVLIRPYWSDSSHRNLGPLMALKPSSSSSAKRKHLPVEEIIETLLGDWRVSSEDRSKGAAVRMLSDAGSTCSYSYPYPKPTTTPTSATTISSSDGVDSAAIAVPADEKGYYVTGKLSRNIYRDDCEFRSPDPDLPIRGLRKYVGVAPMLFSTKASHSKLLSLEELRADDRERLLRQEQQQQQNDDNSEYDTETDNDIPDATITSTILRATWKMSVTINLPWKPQLSEFTGSTLYFLDEDHLIARHQETWDISVWDAFLEMMNVKNTMFRKGVAGLGVGLGGGNSGPKAKIKTNKKCPVASFFRTNTDPRLHSHSHSHLPLSRNITVN